MTAMKFGSAFGFVALVGLAATISVPVEAAFAQQKPAEARYVKVGASGAKLYNLADKGADVVLEPAAGTVLQVHGESAGYLEVCAPDGLQVWVFGEYAKPASEPGMLEITANAVGMRPQPNASEKSYRLAQRLNQGDKVRYLGRNDATKPTSEDWLKVQSPPSARAWVLASDTTALAAGEDGKALFAAAQKELAAKAKVEAVPGAVAATTAKAAEKPATPKADSTGTPGAPVAAGAAAAAKGDLLAQAEKLYEAALKTGKPDFAPAKAAYQKVIDVEKQGPAVSAAQNRLEQIGMREEIAALQADAEKSQGARKEELERKAAELREASLYQDRLWGRFQERGWLERDGDRYLIRWANKVTSEVVCTQKRYDLARFVGFEVGLAGTVTRSSAQGTIPADAKPGRIDVTRLEVLSGAGSR
jgi:hypothetical protein